MPTCGGGVARGQKCTRRSAESVASTEAKDSDLFRPRRTSPLTLADVAQVRRSKRPPVEPARCERSAVCSHKSLPPMKPKQAIEPLCGRQAGFNARLRGWDVISVSATRPTPPRLSRGQQQQPNKHDSYSNKLRRMWRLLQDKHTQSRAQRDTQLAKADHITHIVYECHRDKD